MRLLIDGEIVDLPEAVEALKKAKNKEAHVVVDRLVVQDDIRKRLVDSIEVCSRDSEGHIELLLLSERLRMKWNACCKPEHPDIRWLRHPAGILVKFSEAFECQLCHISYQEPEPRLFSFNNPFGACPECQGFGNTLTIDFDLIIPDKSKSLAEGAIHPWTKPRYRNLQNRLLQFAGREGIPVDTPWNELPEDARNTIIERPRKIPRHPGIFRISGTQKIQDACPHLSQPVSRLCHMPRLPRRQVAAGSAGRPDRRQIDHGCHPNDHCAGGRLFCRRSAFPPSRLPSPRRSWPRFGTGWICWSGSAWTTSRWTASLLHFPAANRRGFNWRPLSDPPWSARCMSWMNRASDFTRRDSRRLVEILQSLKSLGNTVLVVEHDPEIMRSADYMIDLGPRAGENGGEVVFQGSYPALLQDSKSLTSRYLSGELKISVPIFRRKSQKKSIEILNATQHNLKHLNVHIPLGILVCITGVSGSGKSTLVHDVLYSAIKKSKGRDSKNRPEDSTRSAEPNTFPT